jgi:2-polyprenyl-3-methyl-5-hydroxy-6-metoxy-1,4-benzoquinol methylase
MGDYTLDQGLGVRERMDLLAAVHGPATTAVLDRIGVAEGARCLDLGCGGGHVALELARRLGPTGQVVGIDLDEALLATAREVAAAQGLDNVTFRSERAPRRCRIPGSISRSRGSCCRTSAIGNESLR